MMQKRLNLDMAYYLQQHPDLVFFENPYTSYHDSYLPYYDTEKYCIYKKDTDNPKKAELAGFTIGSQAQGSVEWIPLYLIKQPQK